MKWFGRLIGFVCRDKRSGREQAREREFIDTLNGLKTLRVTPDGGMSIDPEEIRDRVIASRHALKHFVRRP
ncbi:hypothetical protein [Pseudomonas sp. 65/3-MNA-CIBAN-0223]|uniref:hypothetical protein n=1 Tax=Pseudomonas sp. 65/3-MNA-CIBAN-0223 TaxID=3140476 RepID=UPI003317A25C